MFFGPISRLVLVLLTAVLPTLLPAWEVASLHPLLGDMARRIGGDRITVIDLIGPGDNPHEFDPNPRTLASASRARLILASGKGLESAYIEKLEDSLRPEQEIVDLGHGVHSLVAADGNPAPCCAHHRHTGIIDPHWWHDPNNMRRAARHLARAMGEVDAENAEYYAENADIYREELAALDDWIANRIAEIPPERRLLATSHLAFGYLCERYGFTAIGIQGVNREDSPSPRTLGGIVDYLRTENVPVVFPEVGANPKALATIAAEAGIDIGAPLYADGSGLAEGMGYPEMMRSNIDAIIAGLAR